MKTFDEFKKFAGSLPHLAEAVRKKSTTWQDLYETYDIYGKEAEIFKEPMKEEKVAEEKEVGAEEKKDKKEVSSLVDLITGFDADKIAEGLSGMKKILGVLGEFSKPEEGDLLSKRHVNRPYQRNDD